MTASENRESRCPICTGQRLPPNASKVIKYGTICLLQGEIVAVAHPPHGFTSFGEYPTASLYLRKGPVKYLKFRTGQELDSSGLKPGDKVQLEGCLHDVDGEELVFDVRDIVTD